MTRLRKHYLSATTVVGGNYMNVVNTGNGLFQAEILIQQLSMFESHVN